MLRSKKHFAFIAGVFAALGSAFGKLSGSADILNQFIFILISSEAEKRTLCLQVLQLVCFILMIICNASVWTFYVKALNSSSSSLPATVISTATNYVTSALIGIVLFQEATSLLWWTGTGLVVLGLAIIAKNVNKNSEKTE